jgi:dipeptidase E
VPYLGASAGTVVACPTLKTTNDMPILKPPSFKALRLIPFHINPHYVDNEPGARYKMGAREHRLGEFVLENKEPVVALRDGAMLSFRLGSIMLKGTASALIFRCGARPTVIASGMPLESSLLKSSKRGTGDNTMAANEPTIKLTDEQQAQIMNATGKSIAGLDIDFLADLLAGGERPQSGPAFAG